MMDAIKLKHVIALLLEDASEIQQIKPNAGTEARIWLAKEVLHSGDDERNGQDNPTRTDQILSKLLSRLDHVHITATKLTSRQEKLGLLLPELEIIQSELKQLR